MRQATCTYMGEDCKGGVRNKLPKTWNTTRVLGHCCEAERFEETFGRRGKHQLHVKTGVVNRLGLSLLKTLVLGKALWGEGGTNNI